MSTFNNNNNNDISSINNHEDNKNSIINKDKDKENSDDDDDDDDDEFTCKICDTTQGINNCEKCDKENSCEDCEGQGGDYGPNEIWVCNECLPVCLKCGSKLSSSYDKCCDKGRSDLPNEDDSDDE
jgi:hypothetical protein